jgi:GAF domain-containing protein
MKSNLSKIEELTKKLNKSDSVIRSISKVQSMFINEMSHAEVFEEILSILLKECESEYGFIGEVLHKDDTPYLKTYAITNIAWNDATRSWYEQNVEDGLEFTNLKSLFGVTIETGEIVISNEPASDERRTGLPEGHPALNHYLGVPIKYNGKMIGMFGVSNREGGYDMEVVNDIEPLINTAAQIIVAKKREDKKKQVLDNLTNTIKSLKGDDNE